MSSNIITREQRSAMVDRAQQGLARRSELIDNGGATRNASGALVVAGGWDANEVVGRDGLATDEQGNVNLWSGRGIVPWHRLGTVTQDAKTADEALALSGLNVEHVLRPLAFSEFDPFMAGPEFGRFRPIPGKYAVVRADNNQPKGVVGRDYRIIQNSEAFGFLTDLVGDSGVLFDTAGELRDGTVFMSLRLPEAIKLDADGAADVIEPYIMARNSFDGSTSFEVVTTPFRPVCGNTVRWATQAAISRWTVRHTSGATDRVQAARETLRLSADYFSAFAEEATAMIQTGMTDAQFDAFLADVVFPVDADASDRVRRNANDKRDQARQLFREADTQANIRNTVWAAEQALIEQVDHLTNVRVPKTLTADLVRANRATAGTQDARKSFLHRQLLTRTNR